MYKVIEHGNLDSKKVIFMFGGAGVPAWQMKLPLLPINSFVKAGWHVIYYEFPWGIVYTANEYIQTLQEAYLDAVKRLERLPRSTRVAVWGLSLGSLPATRFATSSKRVSDLILNVPYADPLTNLEDFEATRRYSYKHAEQFLENAKSKKWLTKSFAPFSPLLNAKKMKHLRVCLLVAKQDKFFKYAHATKLKEAIGANAKSITYSESEKLGHYFGGSKHNFQSNKVAMWLEA